MLKLPDQTHSFFREFPNAPNWRLRGIDRAGKLCSYRDLRYLPLSYGSIIAATINPKFDPPKIMRTRPFQVDFHEDGSVTATWVITRSIAQVNFDSKFEMLPTFYGGWRASMDLNFDPNDPAQMKEFKTRVPRTVANHIVWNETSLGWEVDTLSMQFFTPYNPPGSRFSVHAEFQYTLHPQLVKDEVFRPNDNNIQLPEAIAKLNDIQEEKEVSDVK